MAFFKFRWPGRGERRQAEKPSKRTRAPQAESIDEMRRRARHRLIGAAVLVLIGVVGFPLLFDAQPRPVAVDIPIDIPDRNKVAPLVVPAQSPVVDAAKVNSQTKATALAPVGAGVVAKTAQSAAVVGGLADGEELVPSQVKPNVASGSSAVSTAKNDTKTPAKAEAKSELRAEVKPESKHEPKLPPKPENKPDTKLDTKPDSKPALRTDEASRARALLEGRSVPAVSAEAEDGRFIVQVGAFADADKAREVRAKVERLGVKTYTQVVDTKEGKRTRVRVGPFANRAEADKAAARIKGMELPASVLAL